MSFLDAYEDVDSRIHRFYEVHPEGRITSELVHHNDDFSFVVFKAFCFRPNDAEPAGTGHAYEMAGTSNVNKTSHIENCETSAVGRALANAGFSPKGSRPSREEMGKAAAGMVPGESPGQSSSSSTHETPAAPACPSCNGPIWDNTNDPNRGRRPLKKCKNGDCGWVQWADKTPSKGGEPASQTGTKGNAKGNGSNAESLGEADKAEHVLTQAPSGNPPLTDPEDLLAIASWEEVKKAARIVLLHLIASGERKNDRIPATVDQLANLTSEELTLVAAHLKEGAWRTS